MKRITSQDISKLADVLKSSESELSIAPKDLGVASMSYLVIPVDPTPREIMDHNCIQSAAYALWGTWAKDAEIRAAELKKDLEFFYADAYPSAKEALGGKAGRGGATETAIRSKIRSTHKEELTKREKEIKQAERDAALLKAVKEAWDQKGTLLAAMTRMCSEEMRQTLVTGGGRSSSDSSGEDDLHDMPEPEPRPEPEVPVQEEHKTPKKKKGKKKSKFRATEGAGIP